MGLTVSQKADTLGTFRYVSVRLMETLAAWVPTSPELEVKTLFGRHIWSLAQHADIIGHRTAELRVKLHYDRPALQPYQAVLDRLAGISASGDRIAGFYDAVLPDLVGRFESYLEATDELLDAPTVEIVRRILVDFEGMQRQRSEVATQRPDVPAANDGLVDGIRRELAACSDFVDYRETVQAGGP